MCVLVSVFSLSLFKYLCHFVCVEGRIIFQKDCHMWLLLSLLSARDFRSGVFFMWKGNKQSMSDNDDDDVQLTPFNICTEYVEGGTHNYMQIQSTRHTDNGTNEWRKKIVICNCVHLLILQRLCFFAFPNRQFYLAKALMLNWRWQFFSSLRCNAIHTRLGSSYWQS